jgi:hypothetical protein
MDQQLYFDSYRQSVLLDAPKDFAEYARKQPTLTSEFPTFFSYLQFVTESIKQSISVKDTKAFDDNIRAHRVAMLELFKKIVAERGTYSEGWKSFKFSNEIAVMSNGVAIVPRHGLEGTCKDKTVVYAEEMKWVKDSETAMKLVKFKQVNGNKFVKVINNDFVGFGDLMNYETDQVIEWTAKL